MSRGSVGSPPLVCQTFHILTLQGTPRSANTGHVRTQSLDIITPNNPTHLFLRRNMRQSGAETTGSPGLLASFPVFPPPHAHTIRWLRTCAPLQTWHFKLGFLCLLFILNITWFSVSSYSLLLYEVNTRNIYTCLIYRIKYTLTIPYILYMFTHKIKEFHLH